MTERAVFALMNFKTRKEAALVSQALRILRL